MRSLRLIFGIGLLAGSATLAGCSGAAGIFSTQDGGGGTGGQGGAAGADAGNPDAAGSAGNPGCDPTASPKNHPCAVNNQHGIFIDATGGSDDTGNGTEQKPYKTFAKGVAEASASGKRLFACAGTYAESVKLGASNNGIEMYGGFDCSSWAYTGAKTEVKDATNGPALALDTVATAHIEDIDFTSSDATTPGNSSVAASVKDSSKIDLVDVVLTAGKGAPGLDGAPFTKSATGGANGNPGNDACHANPNPGGLAATTACGADTSVGGKGGEGAIGASNGGSGDNGQTGSMGIGGNGQKTSTWNCSVGNTNDNGGGQVGANGGNGNPGPGATGLGTLDASGITGVTGSAGTAGKPGQGGGGGGGAQAPKLGGSLVCTVLGTNVGASGGSGGGGGCGGQGGPGGGAGGSSIALVSINSDIVLTGTKLVAVDGGAGGKGALGQTGGNGGNPGLGGTRANTQALPGCPGGAGGLGGNGGPGGGGAGGHSIAIAYTGTAPLVGTGTTMTEATTAAPGGLGGGGSAPNKGADGITKDLQSF